MFNFLNGTALFAAAAALIPLIIHLLSRRKVKVIEFSSVKHLKAMQKRQVRRLKIRQLLLLFLRMAIILAVVIAFARPTSKSGSVGAHASVSAVVLFDNSASMNRYVADGNLFDIAKKRTAELLKTFGQSDQVMFVPLVRSGGEQAPVSFGSAATAQEMLDAVQAGYGTADLQRALESTADQLKNATNLNKEIYVVSDRQRSSLPDKEPLAGAAAKVYLVDLPLEQTDNLGVTAIDFGGQLIQPGIDFNLTATVKNYGADDRNDAIASLYIDDRRVSQTEVKVPGSGEVPAKFKYAVSGAGFHSGYVELSDDKFLLDNRYYFSFHIPDKFSVLIIAGDDAAQYLQLALSPSAELSQAWDVKISTPAQLSGVDLNEFNEIILAGAPSLDAGYVERIKNFVNGGRSLFVTYGPRTDVKAFDAAWSGVTGVTFDAPLKEQFSRAGYYAFKTIDLDHPVFSVFGIDKNKPPEIKFYTLPEFHVSPNARALITFTGDRPALVETKYGTGKVLTFTGPISPTYTDLPGHAFFVPMISRIAEYLAANLSSLDTRLFIGGPVTRAISYKGALDMSMALFAPDSEEYNLPPEESQGALVVHAKPVDKPGIYSIRYLGRELDRFAANIPPKECDLSYDEPDQFAHALGAKEYKELPVAKPLAATIAGLRFGRELWQVFVWLAVILMAIEMLLARGAEPEE